MIRRRITYLLEQRYIIKTLVIRDFSQRYLSSYIGLSWAFIQPASYIFIIWFAFTYGLRTGTTSSGLPFASWLLAGMIPWMYISQSMMLSCMSVQEYSYLIKKTDINPWVMPLIKILSGFLIHLVLLTSMLLIDIFIYRIYPTIYWFQIVYYMTAMLLLLTGIGWLVSSLNILIPDMSHLVNVLTSMLFWATPILWQYSLLEGNMKYLALLNPFFYITEGYRYTFLEKVWFYQFTEMNIYFWLVTSGLFILGAFTFKKIKPEFGDLL